MAHAHPFDLNRKEVDEMLRIVSEDYHDFEMTDDRMRVRRLRGFCTFICAYLSGRVAASIGGRLISCNQSASVYLRRF